MKYQIGLNCPHVAAEHLVNAIAQVADNGFDVVEYCLSDHPLIVGGQISHPYVDYIRSVFKGAPVSFTGHIGTGLDLRNTKEFALQKSTLRSSIDICETLGIRVLTLHYEDKSMHADVEQAFYDAHLEAADYALQKGVLLLIENIEIDHYQNVLEMVKKADHPNFKMTLDIGHLNLSTNFFGQNFEQAVRECAPYVRHLHISDNVGKFETMRLTNFDLYRTVPMGMRIAFGQGDIHVPPFYGTIDIPLVFRILKEAGFSGVFLCEYYNELYNPLNKSIQENVRSKVAEIFG